MQFARSTDISICPLPVGFGWMTGGKRISNPIQPAGIGTLSFVQSKSSAFGRLKPSSAANPRVVSRCHTGVHSRRPYWDISLRGKEEGEGFDRDMAPDDVKSCETKLKRNYNGFVLPLPKKTPGDLHMTEKQLGPARMSQRNYLFRGCVYPGRGILESAEIDNSFKGNSLTLGGSGNSAGKRNNLAELLDLSLTLGSSPTSSPSTPQ